MRRLGDGYAAGVLGTDTFDLRLERAWRARSLGELQALTRDLPRRLGETLRDEFARLRERVLPLAAAPTVDVALPSHGDGPWTIGRSADCGLVVDDDSVSRRHAELRRVGDGWELRDLRSTNGTRVNGWRVAHAVPIRAGDELWLGDVRVRLR